MLEVIGDLILCLMIIGSGVLIVYVNVRENPYEKEIKGPYHKDNN